jgi:mRNA interferase YafQ
MRSVLSPRYKRDIRKARMRGYRVSKLFVLVNMLERGETLPQSAGAHPLRGEWQGYWECHIAFDWVLIYKIAGNELRLARTGSHRDLFGE